MEESRQIRSCKAMDIHWRLSSLQSRKKVKQASSKKPRSSTNILQETFPYIENSDLFNSIFNFVVMFNDFIKNFYAFALLHTSLTSKIDMKPANIVAKMFDINNNRFTRMNAIHPDDDKLDRKMRLIHNEQYLRRLCLYYI